MSFPTIGTVFATGTNYEDSAMIEALENAEPFQPDKMTKAEKKVYYAAIDKEVKAMKNKYGKEFNEKMFKKELIKFLETENSYANLSTMDKSLFSSSGMTRAGSWIPDIKLTNDFVAAAINVIISTLVGGVGVASLSAYIKKVGLNEAKKNFTRTLASKLKAWGFALLATKIDDAFEFMMNYLNPGYHCALFLDSIDSYPNNGYLDIVL